MVIYGTRTTELGKEHLIDKCPNCGTQNSIDIYVVQKYAHVFWIPFCPTGKTGVSQCSHCKQVLNRNEMPSHLATRYENLKAQLKTPIWTYLGLAVIAGLFIIAVISDKDK